MDGHPRRPLVAACEVVRYPSYVSGEGGVDAADGDEDACVYDSRDAAVCGGADADDESDSDGAHAGEDVGRALAGAVGEPGYDDGENGCRDVDGDGQELGGGGCIT